MRQMNSMMNSMFPDPFAGMFGPMPGAHPFDGGLLGQSALTGGPLAGAMMQHQALMQHGHQQQQQHHHQLQQQARHPHHQHQHQQQHHHPQQHLHQHQQHMLPYGVLGALNSANGLVNFNRMMMGDLGAGSNVGGGGGGAATIMNLGGGGAGGTSFSSSQVVTMSRGPDGRQQVYKATSSTKTGPGGVRETQKTVQDSRSGVKKMAIGHHIGERSHVVERERNYHTGAEEERQDFINLEEDEADDFNREFAQRSRSLGMVAGGASGSAGRRAPAVAAIMPAVPAAIMPAVSPVNMSQSPAR